MSTEASPTAADLLAAAPPPAGAPAPSAASDQAAPTPGASQPAPEPVNAFRGVMDSRGVEFHPAKFRLKDGQPQLDKLGRFVPLGSGRKNEADTAATVTAPKSTLPADGPANPEEEPVIITAELSVEVAIGLIQTVLIMIGEDEGELTEIEVKMLKKPMLHVLQKYGMSDKMTPELEAAAVVAVIVMRRIRKPKTQAWFQSKLIWLRSLWTAWRIKRAPGTSLPV